MVSGIGLGRVRETSVRRLVALVVALTLVFGTLAQAASDPQPIVTFTFTDFEELVTATEGRVDINVRVEDNGAISNATPLRYRATLLRESTAVVGQTIYYPDVGDNPTDRSTWSSFSTDESGQAYFGPASGFTLADVPLTSLGGVTTPFAASVAAGNYTLTVELLDWTDPNNPITLGAPGSVAFSVPPRISISLVAVAAGSRTWDGIPVDVTGYGTSFEAGATTVSVLDASQTEIPGAVVNPKVSGPTGLNFELGGTYTPEVGTYTVLVATGSEVLQATFRAEVFATLSPWRVPFTDQPTRVTVNGGTQLIFDTSSPPVITLSDSTRTPLAGYVSNITVDSSLQASFDLAGGLPAGSYYVTVDTLGTVQNFVFDVMLALTPNRLVEGYSTPVSIAVEGGNFDVTSSVEIYRAWTETLETTGQNLSVTGGVLTFDLPTSLSAATYTVRVITTGSQVAEGELVVDPQLSPPPTLWVGNARYEQAGAGGTSQVIISSWDASGQTYTIGVYDADPTVGTADVLISGETTGGELTLFFTEPDPVLSEVFVVASRGGTYSNVLRLTPAQPSNPLDPTLVRFITEGNRASVQGSPGALRSLSGPESWFIAEPLLYDGNPAEGGSQLGIRGYGSGDGSFRIDFDNSSLQLTEVWVAQRETGPTGQSLASDAIAVTAEAGDLTPPGRPTDVTLVPGDGEVRVSWSNPTDSDFARVVIWVFESESGSPTMGYWAPDDASSFVVTGLTSGVTYELALQAVDTSGNSEDYSTLPRLAVTPVQPPLRLVPNRVNVNEYPPPAELLSIEAQGLGTAFTGGVTLSLSGTTADATSAISNIVVTDDTSLTFDLDRTALNPGTYTLTVTQSDGRIFSAPFTLVDLALRNVRVRPGDGMIRIDWEDPPDPLFTGVAISWGGTVDDVFAAEPVNLSPGVQTYTITGLTNGTQYTVGLRPLSNDASPSGWWIWTATPNVPLFTLVDLEGSPIPDVTLQVMNADAPAGETTQYIQTGADGAVLSGVLTPGNYLIVGWDGPDGQVATDIRFTINDDGTVSQDGDPTSRLVVPDPNVLISVTRDDAPLAGVRVYVVPVDEAGNQIWPAQRWSWTDDAGQAAFYLTDGRYVIYGIGEGETGWTNWWQEFEVIDGQASPLTIALRSANVTGTVTRGEGTPAWAWVNFFNPATGEWFGDGTDQNGNFALYLPPGSYYVQSVWAEDTYYTFTEAEYPVTVDETGIATPSSLTIDLPAPNVSGTAYHADGQALSGGGSLFIEGSTTSEEPLSRWVPIGGDGTWSTNLPDGTYRVTSLWANGRSYPVDFEFTVAGSQFDLVVQAVTPNVSGIAYDEAGNAITEGWIVFVPAGTTDWSGARGTSTGENGAFEIYLPAGDWEVAGVGNEDTWYDPSLTFTVEGSGNLPLDVRPDRPNVTGQVLDGQGNPVREGWLYIGRVGDSIRNVSDWSQVRWVMSDEAGDFSLNLPDGDYTAFYVWSEEVYFEAQIDFSVVGGALQNAEGSLLASLEVAPMPPSVTGTVSDRNDAQLSNAWVAVRPAGSTDWSSVVWAETDDQGNFSLVLDAAGEYEIFGISTGERWIELRPPVVFTFNGTNTADVTISEPRPNLTGTVRDAEGLLVTNGWIGFRPDSARDDWSQTVWARTDENGLFEMSLSAGDWIAANIQGGPNDVYYDLTDAADVFTLTTDLATLDFAPPANNVSGTVYSDASATTALANAWLAIKPASAGPNDWSQVRWVKSDGSGNFSTYLLAGEYRVVQVYSDATSYETNIQLTVPQSSVQVAPPASFVAGTLKVNGAVASAWVGIRPADENGVPSSDATSTIWVEATDGTWTAVLADGNYAVVAVDDGADRYTVDVRFTVTNGAATVDVQVIAP